MRYLVRKDVTGQWRWRLCAPNQRLIAESGEGYRNRQDCLDAIALVKGAGNAPVEDE